MQKNIWSTTIETSVRPAASADRCQKSKLLIAVKYKNAPKQFKNQVTIIIEEIKPLEHLDSHLLYLDRHTIP